VYATAASDGGQTFGQLCIAGTRNRYWTFPIQSACDETV